MDIASLAASLAAEAPSEAVGDVLARNGGVGQVSEAWARRNWVRGRCPAGLAEQIAAATSSTALLGEMAAREKRVGVLEQVASNPATSLEVITSLLEEGHLSTHGRMRTEKLITERVHGHELDPARFVEMVERGDRWRNPLRRAALSHPEVGDTHLEALLGAWELPCCTPETPRPCGASQMCATAVGRGEAAWQLSTGENVGKLSTALVCRLVVLDRGSYHARLASDAKLAALVGVEAVCEAMWGADPRNHAVLLGRTDLPRRWTEEKIRSLPTDHSLWREIAVHDWVHPEILRDAPVWAEAPGEWRGGRQTTTAVVHTWGRCGGRVLTHHLGDEPARWELALGLVEGHAGSWGELCEVALALLADSGAA